MVTCATQRRMQKHSGVGAVPSSEDVQPIRVFRLRLQVPYSVCGIGAVARR